MSLGATEQKDIPSIMFLLSFKIWSIPEMNDEMSLELKFHVLRIVFSLMIPAFTDELPISTQRSCMNFILWVLIS